MSGIILRYYQMAKSFYHSFSCGLNNQAFKYPSSRGGFVWLGFLRKNVQESIVSKTYVLTLQWLSPSRFEQVGWFYSPLMITYSLSTVIMTNPNAMLLFLLYMKSLDPREFLLFLCRWNSIKISTGSCFVKALSPDQGLKG